MTTQCEELKVVVDGPILDPLDLTVLLSRGECTQARNGFRIVPMKYFQSPGGYTYGPAQDLREQKLWKVPERLYSQATLSCMGFGDDAIPGIWDKWVQSS